MAGVRDSARQLGDPYPFGESTDVRLRSGVVTARSGHQCSVQFAGANTARPNVMVLAGAGPIVGQTVWVLQSGGQDIILGQVGANDNPYCRVRRTSNQSIGHAVDSAVVWQSVLQNDAGMWSAGASDWKVFFPVRGWYAVAWNVRWAANATGERYGGLWVNSDSALRYAEYGTQAGGVIETMNGAGLLDVDAGSQVALYLWQTSGVTLSITPTFTYSVSLFAHWIGPGSW